LEGRPLAFVFHRRGEGARVQARQLQVAEGGIARRRRRPAGAGGVGDGRDCGAGRGCAGIECSAGAVGERREWMSTMSDDLPEGWSVVLLKEVALMRLGKMLDAKKQANGKPLPYLRNINVRWGVFDLSQMLTMVFLDDEVSEFDLRPGDVLVCEGGEPGRAAVWHDRGSNIKFQKAIHRVRLQGGIDPHWLMYHLRHDALRGGLDEYFTGSTIKHLTGVSLARYALNVAPLSEQQRIVGKVGALLAR